MIQKKKWYQQVSTQVLLIIISIIMFLPFIWMIITSFKDEADIFTMPPRLFGIRYSFDSYRWLFQRMPFFQYMLNTAKVTVIVAVLQLLTSSLGGYAFTRFEFKLKEPLFLLYISAMMIPAFVTLVPSFILFRNLGLYDTHWPLILPGISSAFGTFMMRQFFSGIPKELDEAALIDGCNPLTILLKIYLPLSKPALTTLAIFIFNGVWNDYLAPLIYIVTPSKMTLTVAVSMLQMSYATSWGLLMAGLTISVLPVLVAFLCAQDVFVKGIALTGIKA